MTGSAPYSAQNARRQSDQLIFTPEVCATFAHFSISAATKVANAAGVIDSGTTPWFAHDSLISVELRIFRISALRRSTIGFGVAAGAAMPTQPDAWKPGTPASEIVGTSGRLGERSCPVVPSARTSPASTLGPMVAMVSNIISTCPPRMSLRAPVLLL